MVRPTEKPNWENWTKMVLLQRELYPAQDEYANPYTFDSYDFKQVDCGRDLIKKDELGQARIELEAARDWGQKARTSDARLVQIEALLYLGDIHRRQNDQDQASQEYQQAIQLLEGQRAHQNLGAALFRYATLCEEMGEWESARAAYIRVRALWQTLAQENSQRGNWKRHDRYKEQRIQIERQIEEVMEELTPEVRQAAAASVPPTAGVSQPVSTPQPTPAPQPVMGGTVSSAAQPTAAPQPTAATQPVWGSTVSSTAQPTAANQATIPTDQERSGQTMGTPGQTNQNAGSTGTPSPFAAPPVGAGEARGGPPPTGAVPPSSGGMPGGAPASGRAVTPRGPHGNYAITVACHSEKPKRSFPKPSWGFLLLLAFAALGALELIAALWLVPDRMAQIILVTLFIVTVLIFLVFVALWRFYITIPPGSVGILLGGGGKPTLLEGPFWRLPVVETLYDVVPLGQREYKCRLEFSEREGSSPIIFQEIKIQYHVARAQLEAFVANQRSSRDEHSKHPLTDFWESQLGDHLQRYFEDMSPAEIDQALEKPHELEPKILKMLRANGNKHQWGIEFTDEEEDVHLGHYRIERWQ